MDYDEKSELRAYVVCYLWHLLTDSERERIWAEFRRGKQEFWDWAVEQSKRRRAGLGDQAFTTSGRSPGYYEFLDEVVSRVLREKDRETLINRCPKCHAVLRTPQAKVCLWCGHSQY